ncbi:MAG TPA: hypothetical protein VGE74_09650 [Gemmata sp.]
MTETVTAPAGAPKPAAMELREAKDMIRRGAAFGDVFPLVDELNQDVLKRWFVSNPGVPVRKPQRPVTPAALPVATGDLCKRCGGLLVRTGTCMTCQACGDNSGCG